MEEIRKMLSKRMSLVRLAKTGFFKRIPPSHPSLERDLFLYRSILDRALIDSFSQDEEIRQEVEDWLDLYNDDFLEICNNADLPPEKVLKAFREMKKILRGRNATFPKFGKKR